MSAATLHEQPLPRLPQLRLLKLPQQPQQLPETGPVPRAAAAACLTQLYRAKLQTRGGVEHAALGFCCHSAHERSEVGM